MTGVEVSERTVEVAGVTIRYRAAGASGAQPVVLLHGGASRAATWDRLAAALVARGRRIVAADLRGHGGSSRTADYPLRGYRDDILGLLDALAIERAALVGHSLGGHVASLLAQDQPDRFTRLVLEEPPVPSRELSDRHGLSSARFLLPALGSFGTRRGYDRRAVVSAVRQLRVPDPSWWDRLPAVSAPALLVSGGPRSHVPPQRLAEVRDGRLVTIPVGHRVHSRAPERFRDAVVPFLTG
ncbi:alpha/beta fold hydrolase [Rugosimonospora africana]|uniref:Alpha/beta hydrolase n=1 Tax=Rugosimonospora africana TaxID=556532 RepID=A0A8J3R1L3_9ACTN|nr:alpha/beta hydrolase [Rugosimonospora africana]GIH20129.1 alpha/beta hydrolase [Rugosimonospora africana]